MEKQITVLAAVDFDSLETKGADMEDTYCQTVAEAKKRARYFLTEEFMNRSESTVMLSYAQVKVNGICVADYFGGR